MAFQINRLNGQNYAENLVNDALSFNDGIWNISSGTGTASLVFSDYIEGNTSLRIQNNTPVSDITVTNSSQDTIVPTDGDYQISLFLKKNIANEVRTVDVLVYEDSVLLDTQSCVLGSTDASDDVNDVWQRFQLDQNYSFSKASVITFQFVLKGVATSEPTTFVYIDALMLNIADRGNTIVPSYVKPNSELNRLSDIPAPPSADGNYQLNVLGGVYTWTEII